MRAVWIVASFCLLLVVAVPRSLSAFAPGRYGSIAAGDLGDNAVLHNKSATRWLRALLFKILAAVLAVVMPISALKTASCLTTCPPYPYRGNS